MLQLLSTGGPVLLPLLLQLIGLTFAVLIDPYIRKKHKSVMLVIAAVVLLILLR